MRRILVDHARRKHSQKRGGLRVRHDVDDLQPADRNGGLDVLALDEALDYLASRDSDAAELVKLRFFVGMTMHEAAKALGISDRTADRVWNYARSFLLNEMRSASG
jgi:RNA polymerase sigma factor (TIGR02999 family)